MAQLPSSQVVEPFGEVNVWQQLDGSLKVKATILMSPTVEGAQTGLAIDGSASMKGNFGTSGAVSALFAPSMPNIVETVARTLSSYLANFDSDGQTTVIYWAVGPGGGQIQELGDLTVDSAKAKHFNAPKQFGTGTQLLPALKYFTDARFSAAPWGLYVFITDGLLDDLPAVKQYTLDLAKEIAAGQRNATKLVLIGVGTEVDVGQLEALDDLDYGGLIGQDGQPVDLWDYKLAAEMQKVEEIFAEVVSSDTILAPSATIVDDRGRPVQPLNRASYNDGLPALIEFVVPAGATSFQLTLPSGAVVNQNLVTP